MYLVITFYFSENFHGVQDIQINSIQCHVYSFHLTTLCEADSVSKVLGHKNEEITKISYLF